MAIAHPGHEKIYSTDDYATRSTSLKDNYFIQNRKADEWASTYAERIQQHLDAEETCFSINADNGSFPPSISGIQNALVAYAMNQREWRTANGRVALTAISNVTNVSSYRWLSKFNFEANYPEAKPDPKPTEFDGYFTVKSALSGDASLDVASGSLDPGANVQLWTANGTSAQVLRFRYDAHAGDYEITNAKSGLALDVQGGSARPGGNVQQFTRNGTGAQRWAIADNADGTVTIASAKNPSCVLDAAGGKSARGTNVQLYRSNGTTAQKWVLESH